MPRCLVALLIAVFAAMSLAGPGSAAAEPPRGAGEMAGPAQGKPARPPGKAATPAAKSAHPASKPGSSRSDPKVVLPASGPSFACTEARSGREFAVCADKALTAADRDLAQALAAALEPLDPGTRITLAKDQKRYLADLDLTFEAAVWSADTRPDADELRAAVTALKRGDDPDLIAALEARLRARTDFLRALAPGAGGYLGLWKNADAELLVTAGAKNRLVVAFGTSGPEVGRAHCHFTAEFRSDGPTPVTTTARNIDPDVGAEVHATLRLARLGRTLLIVESFEGIDPTDPARGHVCPSAPSFTGALFPTSLKPDQAKLLKPEAP